MSHHHLRRRHAHGGRVWPDPLSIVSAIAAPFTSVLGADAQPQATVTSYVYKTMSPTFEGPIAGYTTPGAPADQPAAATSTPNVKLTTVTTILGGHSSTDARKTKATVSRSDGLPASILPPSTSVASTLPIFSASQTTIASSSTPASAMSASTSISSSLDSTSSSSGDMTAGAKAGLAIGIILAIGAIASIVIFCIRQRKEKAQMQRLEDEKYEVDNDPFFGNRAPSTRTAKTASTAPRLSLRPVTQFLPGFGDNRNNGRANNLYPNDATAAVPMQSQPPSSRSAWERPMNSDKQNRANPFGNHAETIDPVNANGPSIIQGTGPGAERIVAGAAAGAATGPAVGLTRGASKRGFGPNPLDYTKTLPSVGPPSPALTEFSMTEAPGAPVQTSGAAAIAAAGGPQNSVVHRVQLDFKPSMDDELELHAGQLIRLLHEYDDGWVCYTEITCISNTNCFTGSMHSSRPHPARRCSTNMSFHTPCEAAPSAEYASW
jgi:hypothetical protein